MVSLPFSSIVKDEDLSTFCDTYLLGWQDEPFFFLPPLLLPDCLSDIDPTLHFLPTSPTDVASDHMVDAKPEVKKCSQFEVSDIRPHFYMPMTRAAVELGVGVTLLKKRCRELGIRRWPCRKLRSIQTLIDNVKVREMDEAKMREAVERLEEEKKSVEEMPDADLQDKTKRLRQAYFKANYKKKKSITNASKH